MKKKKLLLRGDTLVEVMFSVGIFGIISVSAISLMNRGLNTAQVALETTMARLEIDAQAEALRFIHDATAAETENSNKEYTELWNNIIDLAYNYNNDKVKEGSDFLGKYPSEIITCSDAYDDAVFVDNSFVINTHSLSPSTVDNALNQKRNDNSNKLVMASTYPRLIFGTGDDASIDAETISASSTNLYRAEGIWVTGVKSQAGGAADPQYYDFYIRTCWDAVGRGTPVTISTTIRLYNPFHT